MCFMNFYLFFRFDFDDKSFMEFNDETIYYNRQSYQSDINDNNNDKNNDVDDDDDETHYDET